MTHWALLPSLATCLIIQIQYGFVAQGIGFSRDLYEAWERGLRRELTTRELDAPPPVAWT